MGSYSGPGMSQEDIWNQGRSDWQNQNYQTNNFNNWQSTGFDPNNPFGTTYRDTRNSLTDPFMMTPDMMDKERYRSWDEGRFRDFLDPSSGLRNISISGIPGMGDITTGINDGRKYMRMDQVPGQAATWGSAAGGGGPNAAGGVPGPYEGGQYTAPDAWGGYEFDVSQLDPNKAIESWEPYMAEQREKGFAEAGNRMGQSGMVSSTPYAEALGGVARKSTDDMGRLAAEYQYRAQESMAQRDLERQMAEQGAGLQAWGQQGDWQSQGQLADLAREFGGWQTQGGWQQQANQNQADRDLSQWQTNQYNNQNQQNMMMQMLGSFMGG